MVLNHIHKHIVDHFELNLKNKSPKGWILSEKCCPFCGKDNKHFGIRLNTPKGTFRRDNFISFHCLKCGEKGGEYKLFKEMGDLHILEQGKYVNLNKRVKKRIVLKVEDIPTPSSISPNFPPPLGFRKIKNDQYLQDRGFEEWQYEMYSVGKTKLVSNLKDYITFLIIENGECKGSVSRTTKSNDWIKGYNEEVKEYNKTRQPGTKKKLKWLRYRNDEAHFNKLVMGIDEVTPETKSVILVEGIMDKANVDRLLKLNKNKKIKCLCTFGKKVSDEQISKIKSKGVGVETVLVIFDPDALEDSKGEGWRLKSQFKQVLVGFTRKNDPGDMELAELKYIIKTAEPPLLFKLNKISKRRLK